MIRLPSFVLFLVSAAALCAADRPNFLWITSEDNSPYLGCYGDALAQTPQLDALAAQGIRYRNAFANAPVCSTARTTLITGMYASSLGVQHHRSNVRIPARFQLYPQHLRAAGYYATNNVKTDYNVPDAPRTIWDESSARAHYRNRPAGKPFFAVFNFTTSHESQVAPKAGKTTFRIAPEKMPLPPYHPDTPEIRRDWANYYDQMTELDGQVGQVLAELKEAGLAEDTIVFYYGDHGGALPRGKRNLHDSGTRVPLIVRIPAKWAHLAPVKAGEWCDELVSFVDLPPTIFALAGIPVPSNYEGRPFLGANRPAPRSEVYLLRGRMDERMDFSRAVRDAQARYVRNFAPHRPWGQHYTYPFQVQPSMRSWYAEYAAGRTNAVQSAYWQPKAAEEFYRPAADPFEVKNLSAETAAAADIARLRRVLRAEMLRTRDTGFIPEGMYARLAGEGTIYDYAQSEQYPLARLLDLADLATARDPRHLPALTAALADAHPLIRYWGATGCLVLQGKAAPAKEALKKALADEWPDVRVVAAEALGYLGEKEAGFTALVQETKNPERYVALAAQNALEYFWRAGHATLAQVQDAVKGPAPAEPLNRVPAFLLGQK